MRLLFLRFGCLSLLGGLLLVAAPAQAQAPGFGSVITVGAGSTGTVQVGKTASDAQGNRYLTGAFTGTVAFGSTTLSSPNTSDIFVAKLSSTGACLWARQAGGTDGDSGAGVAVDAQGSVYVTGYYVGPAAFGPFTLTSFTPAPVYGYTDAFVGRLDAAGNWLWVRSAGGNRNEGAGSVVLDAAGNAYIAASFTSLTAQFGPFSVANVDPQAVNVSDAVIAKLDPAGNWRWVRSAGSGAYDWVNRLALDATGHLFAYGNFEGNSLALGGLTVRNSGSGSTDVFVAQLDTAGTWRWARGAGGNFIDLAGGMGLDWAGNAYIAGYFRSSSMGFDALSLPSHSGTSQIAELFVAKIDGTGNWQWARASGSAYNDVLDLTVSPGAEIAVTGSFWGPGNSLQLGPTTLSNSSTNATSQYHTSPTDAFLARLDPKGNWQGASSSRGPGDEIGQSVNIDAAGNLLTTGLVQGLSATFGASTLTGSSSIPTNYVGFVPGSGPLTRVSSVVPGTAAPGTTLTVSGSGLAGATAVLFNGTPTASFTVQSATQLTVVVPADAAVGPISVRTAAGTGSSPTLFVPTVLSSTTPASRPLPFSPNPATDQVRVPSLPVGTRVQLLDALGRLARETTVSATAQVLILGLVPGLYTLRATDAQGQHYAARVAVE